jgi:hypothetical protein
LTKLTGSDTDPAALAPALLARYDIDGNKVLDKVGVMCLLFSLCVWCVVCGVVWCVVCGVVWCGVVWCGVVWCGVVWFGVCACMCVCVCVWCACVCRVQRERSDLTDELTRCIREPFFVFLVSSAFQPGDYLSGVAVLDLQKPLAVQDVNIGIRCHGRVSARFLSRLVLPSAPLRGPV